MDYNKLFQSKIFKLVVRVIVSVIILCFVFKLGVLVGYRKASFSFKWGENYHRNFGGPRGGFFGHMKDMIGKDFIGANGVAGQVIKIDGTAITIKGRDGVEKIVTITDGTTIRRFHDTVTAADINVDDALVVIGAASSTGRIEAKFIRVLPPPQH